MDDIQIARLTKNVREVNKDLIDIFCVVSNSQGKTSTEAQQLKKALNAYNKLRHWLDEALIKTYPEYREKLCTSNNPYRIYGE